MAGAKIAIVGMAGRFPSTADIDGFWDIVRTGREAISDLPRAAVATHVDARTLDHPDYVLRGGLVDDTLDFDRELFAMTAREAELTNPQHRVFLECCHQVLDGAGVLNRAERRVGVYAGEGYNGYFLQLAGNPAYRDSMLEMQALVGNDKDFLATMVSYKLGLTGPALAVQTACSTSLTAVTMACDGLARFDCDLAIAGGVRIGHPQEVGYLYTEGSILSRSGHCRPFSADADGTVGTSGAGVVLLKRLDDAVREGDHIHAVIVGHAVNNDGAGKAGYFAPSITGQREVIFEAHELLGYPPESLGYVETHGTGTALGDSIELEALAQALRALGTDPAGCAVGALKGNFGHMDAAAGVGGLIKAALVLEHQTIPPLAGFAAPNPQLAAHGFRFPMRATPFDLRGDRRRAAVSAFGIGGTNVHVVLEEAPAAAPRRRPADAPGDVATAEPVLLYSAASEDAVEAYAERVRALLGDRPADAPAVASALWHERPRMAVRGFELVGGSAGVHVHRPGPRGPVAFAFSGQGTQYPGMGAHLFAHDPVFRTHVDRLADAVADESGLDIRRLLRAEDTDDAHAELAQTYLTQPALFVLELALARTLQADGVHPSVLLGHSIGELVAGVVAGVFSEEDAVSVVLARGRLMQGMPRGAMLSVALSPAAVADHLSSHVQLCLVNGPDTCVVGGEPDAVRALALSLSGLGIACRPLATSHAFHSRMMAPAAEEFRILLSRIRLGRPAIRMLSNLTGGWLDADAACDPGYWSAQLCNPVRFHDNLELLLAERPFVVEVGPGRSVQGMLRRAGFAADAVGGTTGPRQAPRDTAADYLTTLGRLWCAGHEIAWGRHLPPARRDVRLPTYPYRRRRYEPAPVEPDATGPGTGVARYGLSHTVEPSTAAPGLAGTTWFVDAPAERALPTGLAAATGDLAAWLAAPASGERCYLADLRGWPHGRPPAEAFVATVDRLRLLAESGQVVRVLFVVSGAARVLSRDPVAPLEGVVASLATTLPQEWPALGCRVVDTDEETLTTDILAEALTDRAGRPAAHRMGTRFARAPLPLPTPPGVPLPAPGRVLITGGLGVLGRRIATLLADAHPETRLVLCGRTPAAAAHLPADLDPERVRYVQADLVEPDAVAALADSIEHHEGGIDLIIHCAGRVGTDIHLSAGQLTATDVAAQFGPKVAGTDAVVRLAEWLDPRRVVLVSSVSVTLGGLGLAAYAAANAYLGAVAGARDCPRQRWIAVQLDGFATSPADPAGLTGTELDRVIGWTLLPDCPTEFIAATADLPARHRRWVLDLQPRAETPATGDNEADFPVREILATALGCASVTPDDDFFALGGDSLLASQVLYQVQRRTGVELSLKDFLEHPTAAHLEERIAAWGSDPDAGAQPERAPDGYDRPTRMQTKLYLEEQTRLDTLVNTLTAHIDLVGRLDLDRLRTACRALIDRHEILRTAFRVSGGALRLVTVPAADPPVTVRVAPPDAWAELARTSRVAFQVHEAPLFSVLVLLDGDRARIVFDIHHLIADGVTMSILVRDFCALYNGQALGAPGYTIRDYSFWEEQRADADPDGVAFWSAELAGLSGPALLGPAEPGALRWTAGERAAATVRRTLDDDLRTALIQTARDQRTTLFIVLFSAFEVLTLHRTGRTDAVTGCAFSGRTRPECQEIVGNVIHVHPVRARLDPDGTFADLLADNGNRLRLAAQYQEVPTDTLVPARSGPAFASLFLMQNTGDKRLTLDGATVVATDTVVHAASYPLTVQIVEDPDALRIELIYAEDAYRPDVADRLLADYVALLGRLTDRPDAPLIAPQPPAGAATRLRRFTGKLDFTF